MATKATSPPIMLTRCSTFWPNANVCCHTGCHFVCRLDLISFSVHSRSPAVSSVVLVLPAAPAWDSREDLLSFVATRSLPASRMPVSLQTQRRSVHLKFGRPEHAVFYSNGLLFWGTSF
jgi:hypothetical protein